MEEQTPSIGRIVHYTLSAQDAVRIRAGRERLECEEGNQPVSGEVYPMIITRVWGPNSEVNGQVLLDGNDTLWVTSVHVGEGERTFAWPQKG